MIGMHHLLSCHALSFNVKGMQWGPFLPSVGTACGLSSGPVRCRRQGAQWALLGLVLLAQTRCHGHAPVDVEMNRFGSSGGCLSTLPAADHRGCAADALPVPIGVMHGGRKGEITYCPRHPHWHHDHALVH